MTTAPTLCVLGSINLDMVIQTAHLPRAGETVTQGKFHSTPGGKGANTALAAQRLGANVRLQAAVGNDPYAKEALSSLRAAGVNLKSVATIDKEATGVAFINVAEDGENQIAVASGANAVFSPDHLSAITEAAVLSQFEIPVPTLLAGLNSYDGFVAVNASPFTPDVEKVFQRADLIIVNEGEYAAYLSDLEGYSGLLARTLGGEGAELFKNGKLIATAKPPKVEVIDTTGAGDAFAAALTVALAEGQLETDALNFACTVGALATTKLGAQSAAPTRDEVETLLKVSKT
ncbi:ribokinase [Litorimonas haliclonae]|uniref:ribokinase n=1 Tax=Litorimonas haliclonae TaxID=2081977 RepID=UPI0039EE9FE4